MKSQVLNQLSNSRTFKTLTAFVQEKQHLFQSISSYFTWPYCC